MSLSARPTAYRPTPYWHVDAFAARSFSGNPAAVLKLDGWLPNNQLQAIAAELNLPACAFLVACDSVDADWEICWFSPTDEIMLCGHASLASGFALLGESGGDSVSFKTRHAGLIKVTRKGEAFELALPAIATQRADANNLGIEAEEIRRSKDGRTLVVLADESAVRAIDPEISMAQGLAGDQVICTARGDKSDIVSRVFYNGIEDAVTGSAHAALAPFWAGQLGREQISAHQASIRGGHLSLELQGERVFISGECTLIAKGALYLSG